MDAPLTCTPWRYYQGQHLSQRLRIRNFRSRSRQRPLKEQDSCRRQYPFHLLAVSIGPERFHEPPLSVGRINRPMLADAHSPKSNPYNYIWLSCYLIMIVTPPFFSRFANLQFGARHASQFRNSDISLFAFSTPYWEMGAMDAGSRCPRQTWPGMGDNNICIDKDIDNFTSARYSCSERNNQVPQFDGVQSQNTRQSNQGPN